MQTDDKKWFKRGAINFAIMCGFFSIIGFLAWLNPIVPLVLIALIFMIGISFAAAD